MGEMCVFFSSRTSDFLQGEDGGMEVVKFHVRLNGGR